MVVVIVVFVSDYFWRIVITRDGPRSTLVAALFLLMMVGHCLFFFKGGLMKGQEKERREA